MSVLLPNAKDGKGKRPPGWLVGLLIGALIGAIVRFAAAASYMFYLCNWGGPEFTAGLPESGRFSAFFWQYWPGYIVSPFFGLIIGGVGGATCKPRWGALLGAMLSAGFFFAFCVLPGGFALLYDPQKPATLGRLQRVESLQFLVGIIPMTLAGAVAGGVGAFVGSRFEKKDVD
jgi:hypothetical protein